MTTTRTETALIRELGRVDYEPTFAAMRAFTDARTTDTRDELWIVEHPPVFTLGLAADRGHLLAGAENVPVVQTDRGGEVTFHGPGQVVIYLLMDLRRNKPGGKLYARQFVHKIEQAIINVLAAYNLAGERIDGAPGIYIAGGPSKGAKIAALGLKVRGNGSCWRTHRWRAWHLYRRRTKQGCEDRRAGIESARQRLDGLAPQQAGRQAVCAPVRA